MLDTQHWRKRIFTVRGGTRQLIRKSHDYLPVSDQDSFENESDRPTQRPPNHWTPLQVEASKLAATLRRTSKLTQIQFWSLEISDFRWDFSSFDLYNVFAEPLRPINVDTIVKVDPRTGRTLHSWGAGFFFLPHGISIDQQDNIWLTDVAMHQVGGGFPAEFNAVIEGLRSVGLMNMSDFHVCLRLLVRSFLRLYVWISLLPDTWHWTLESDSAEHSLCRWQLDSRTIELFALVHYMKETWWIVH